MNCNRLEKTQRTQYNEQQFTTQKKQKTNRTRTLVTTRSWPVFNIFITQQTVFQYYQIIFFYILTFCYVCIENLVALSARVDIS